MNLQHFVESLPLQLNVTERSNCPECGNYNTFAVTKKVDGIYWFCFHNSCRAKGKVGGTILKADLDQFIHTQSKKAVPYKIPDSWLDLSKVRWLLNRHHILDVFKDRRVQCCYDPKLDRYVFMIYREGVCYGGIGRSFTSKPKWLFYSHSNQNKLPLVVPKYGTFYSPFYPKGVQKGGIVVEDAISAAAVSHIADGVALLGTHIPADFIDTLRSYDNLVIALDADATGKSIRYQQYLNTFVPTRIVMLEKDLKDITRAQINDLFTWE